MNTSSFIADIFSSSGPIAKNLPGYETRKEQIEMAEAVNKAILDSEVLVVEAGTGVGKSFSYLMPVAQHALDTSSLAIISTNTISLQEQIVHKDIPFLQKALDKDFKAVLVKGRHNYLCLRRLHRSNFKQKDLFADEYEMRQFSRIVAWSYKTKDGSLYDIDDVPDPRVWDMVSANRETCLGKKCPYYKRCFFQNAREKAREASLLIVNHHLFFSNLAIEEEQKRVLPDYDMIVFDEAHSIEGVATEHMGISLSSSGIRYLMDLLFNPRKQKGLLMSVGAHDTMEWVELVRKKSDHLFKEVRGYFGDRKRREESGSMRIRSANFVDNQLSPSLCRLAESLVDAKKNAGNKEDEIELSSFVKKINALNDSLEIILSQSLDNYVYWSECSKGGHAGRVSINAAPINVGGILEDRLFSGRKPMVLTSATLSLDNSAFDYFKGRVGIKNSKGLMLGSPFDYKSQVRMYIARNMPLPARLTEYSHAVAERVKKYIDLTGGNAFVLFTSYTLMNVVHEELEPYLSGKGFGVLKQGGRLGRSKMLSRFKDQSGSVLFGVDSFWQGIDVQGKALSNVIITKLPFAVPDHPVTEARIEDLQRKGKDAFLEYSLPEAVLKFKQGFGRLIRSKRDTGIIAVLDSRILNKSYGRRFLDSIPKCEIVIDK